MKVSRWTQYWHQIGATHRLLIVALTGFGSFFIIPADQSPVIRLALSWVAAGGLYLILTYIMMYFSTQENILGLSKKEDDGAAMILMIIVLAGIASLVTIVIILSGIKALPINLAIRHVGLVLATYIISWLYVHTAFALHYAHVYYQELEKNNEVPLLFASKPKPTYVDFLYFSMVIGMTCQTADVNIASSRIRFLVMLQGMTAFIFNATLLTLAINLISGVVALS
ncbi:DUF1345 domain-containing protein [Polynucleobacter sp. JS-Safj-400b-B2]|uniref:DUF1345 domain-containing protein n=1 Tax=Polynucleobacter sp. JS-Safj-400b-B2 TaxID=2576921 RepID=UPI001C0D9D98|nr:DUF1345 domain-containing protein [Polynucleobacter sp. JS-Safj-400b-B2]MBU3626547.1 DUF1345 domain-containing protein [Polynucleobacter sp. JS-Safj-400b-B2]